MMDTENEDFESSLIKLAHSFYPYNMIEYYDEGYEETIEYKALQKAKESFNLLRKDWDDLLSKIKFYYTNYKFEIEDWIETAPRERCFVGKLVIRQKNHSLLPKILVFNVSFVAPLFSIYTSEKQVPSFVIPPDLVMIYRQISIFIKDFFPDHIELPAALSKMELEGLSIDGVGSPTWVKSDILKKMTLFNAFFSAGYY